MKSLVTMSRRGALTLVVATVSVLGVSAQNVQINGAGATFPYPIYSKWFAEYNKLHPNVADQLSVASARAAASGR